MKTPLQVFTILLLFSSVTFANNFKEVFKISLKKDEQKKILVKYDNKERLFKFRWTLYKNDGLVIFHAYDKMVAQNILYLNHKNQSVRVILRNDGQNFYNPPYFLLKFKEFNPKKE